MIVSFDPHYLGKSSILSYFSIELKPQPRRTSCRLENCVVPQNHQKNGKLITAPSIACANKNAGIIRSCFPQKRWSLQKGYPFEISGNLSVRDCNFHFVESFQDWVLFSSCFFFRSQMLNVYGPAYWPTFWGSFGGKCIGYAIHWASGVVIPVFQTKLPGARREGTCHRITCGL